MMLSAFVLVAVSFAFLWIDACNLCLSYSPNTMRTRVQRGKPSLFFLDGESTNNNYSILGQMANHTRQHASCTKSATINLLAIVGKAFNRTHLTHTTDVFQKNARKYFEFCDVPNVLRQGVFLILQRDTF